MKKTMMALILGAVTLTGMTACTTVKYGDAQEVETVNEKFGSTDLQIATTKMVDSLLASGFTRVLSARGERPVLYVDAVRNRTEEHINTEMVMDTTTTKLLQSGSYRLVDTSRIEAIRDQLKFQNNDELVDKGTATRIGAMVGADYMLTATLAGIDKSAGRTKDVYYNFTFKLIDLKTGLVEWQDQQELRKQRKKGIIGR